MIFRISLSLKSNKSLRSSYGFTLIELLMTLAILGILAALVLPIAQVEIQRGKEQDLRRALREIRRGIDDYKRAAGEGRIVNPAGSSGYPKDLDVLVKGVTDLRDPKHSKIFFLRRIPLDPMLAVEVVTNADSWGKRSYASDASDPQAGDDVYDVYSTSKKIGLNDMAYSQW